MKRLGQTTALQISRAERDGQSLPQRRRFKTDDTQRRRANFRQNSTQLPCEAVKTVFTARAIVNAGKRNRACDAQEALVPVPQHQLEKLMTRCCDAKGQIAE